MKEKKYIYVVVMCEQPRFITKVDYSRNYYEWEKTDVPFAFSKWEYAAEICRNLHYFGVTAFPVVSDYEVNYPFYS